MLMFINIVNILYLFFLSDISIHSESYFFINNEETKFSVMSFFMWVNYYCMTYSLTDRYV